jgi:hypothetical protein
MEQRFGMTTSTSKSVDAFVERDLGVTVATLPSGEVYQALGTQIGGPSQAAIAMRRSQIRSPYQAIKQHPFANAGASA